MQIQLNVYLIGCVLILGYVAFRIVWNVFSIIEWRVYSRLPRYARPKKFRGLLVPREICKVCKHGTVWYKCEVCLEGSK